ncbi:MAG: SDR family NAD(P)-dependent oxidoreductase, partial [Candidatus Thiodiazotropha sp. 6PLUC10]
MNGQQSEVLAGQRAIVTGANSGIGEAVAKGLAQAGAKVAINYVVNEAEAQRVADEIQQLGGEAVPIFADVSNESDVEQMFSQVIELWGSIDILVNNAG